jgi:FkbM family methyltransferase
MNIKDFIKQLKVTTLVEIGSHYGVDTLDFRRYHPSARLVCFEPDPRNLKALHDRNIDKLVELYPYAVSDKTGESEFYLSSGDIHGRADTSIYGNVDWSFSSSLKTPTGHLEQHKWITFPTRAVVKTVSLDEFEPLKNTIIDFIWADVQGAEDLVFSGAKETLTRTRYVYTEYSNTELYQNQLNLSSLLTLFGPSWEVVQIFQDDVLLKNKTFKDE